MLKPRVIPVLLLHDNGLVKTKKFSNPVYVGDPVNAVKIFNLKEVDELVFLDINASKNNTEPDYELIADIATEAFMPFGYGGGVKNTDQIRKLLRVGVEKIIINTALENKDFIKESVKIFGSSTIVASIDVMKIGNNYYLYSHSNKKTNSKIDIFDYIQKTELLGVGEILINNVERDGMFSGYDISFLNKVSELVGVPVIGCGGARDLQDIKELINNSGCTAAAAGSMFVFYGKHKAVLITYPEEKELINL